MKSKRFLCTVLACVVMISCITNAAAIQEEVADDFVEYNTESILTTRAIGEFEMTVSAKTKAIADSSLSLEAGDTVRINASYSPDGSVDFGLVDETAHTIVSKSPEIGVGASYETPVIDKDYAKYTVSIMAASTDGTYSIRYHD